MIDTLALVFGIIYLSVGIVGFILAPGGGLLLGIFEVSTFHHIFHIGIGALGIVCGWQKIGALYCQMAGIVLLLLGIVGFLSPAPVASVFANPAANLLTDNMLHIVTGFILVYFGFLAHFAPERASLPPGEGSK
jgi:hypothetical protein